MSRPYLALWAGLLALALPLVCILIRQRQKYRRSMNRMLEMLDAAMDGSFVIGAFDETMLSAVESKLDGYLSASLTSSRSIEAEKEKIKELIADLSHQTKTPVANILLYAQLLGEQELSQDGKKCVRALQTQAEKLNFLIAALVKLSRLETGILSLHPQQAPLQPLLEEIRTGYAGKAGDKGLTLEVLPTNVDAVFDPKWTVEALGNLVDNAIKYTPAGGVVRVTAEAYELFCRIDVQDNGMGVAEGEVAKIFSRFYRSPAVYSQEGVGIGLYLARQIMAEQGGYLKVKSQPGRGSVFSLFLPMGHASPLQAAEQG